ncbi:MAG: hypothetical protein K9K93_08255 [Acholeplasmataceae bacterium]|nr:hypothetical protein [Acholeplasmataceae bacterium]
MLRLFLRTLLIALFYGMAAGSLVLLGFFLFRNALWSLSMVVMGYLIGRRVSLEGRGDQPSQVIATTVYVLSYPVIVMTFQAGLMALTGTIDFGALGFVNIFSFYRFLWPLTPGFSDLSNLLAVTFFLLGGYLSWTAAGKRFT